MVSEPMFCEQCGAAVSADAPGPPPGPVEPVTPACS
jgi:hypothetical protein